MTNLVSRRQVLHGLAASLLLPPAFAAGELPGDSVYRLDAALSDQDGKAFALADLRGTPVLASMFYTSCDMVCPMIFETVHATLRALPPAQRANVRVLMASFDPARDTTEVLKKTAQARGCDAQWVLARSDEATARKLAAVLGIQYRRLANAEFNHSSTVLLLDAQGRVRARSGKLGAADPAIVAAVGSLARNHPATTGL
ncbi:SCO family protein [Ramlibacter sp. XY19]|uniref:SCO family protein n=1 Tax=Ramlibacter paludis TaxID=2908000 RepID=UPI0023DCAC5B|nr:SCO family protein [Ramlibacter paludis]MCG2595815.1 SCO family protein [Ramlibacter paludis]